MDKNTINTSMDDDHVLDLSSSSAVASYDLLNIKEKKLLRKERDLEKRSKDITEFKKTSSIELEEERKILADKESDLQRRELLLSKKMTENSFSNVDEIEKKLVDKVQDDIRKSRDITNERSKAINEIEKKNFIEDNNIFCKKTIESFNKKLWSWVKINLTHFYEKTSITEKFEVINQQEIRFVEINYIQYSPVKLKIPIDKDIYIPNVILTLIEEKKYYDTPSEIKLKEVKRNFKKNNRREMRHFEIYDRYAKNIFTISYCNRLI